MPIPAQFDCDLDALSSISDSTILGSLLSHHAHEVNALTRYSWEEEVKILRDQLSGFGEGHLFLEFSIPRMGKRADAVILIRDSVFVIEFKVGANSFDRAAIEQVHDYALDLKNFHKGSHALRIVPILIATNQDEDQEIHLEIAADKVGIPICIAPSQLANVLRECIETVPDNVISFREWASSGYLPSPTIIEAARALYQSHRVEDIYRRDAGARNIALTTKFIEGVIAQSRENKRKSVCFVTGVPGAGKTLIGLNLAASRAESNAEEHAVLLSGNGPLVAVLQEALARDYASQHAVSKEAAKRKVKAFIQNVHHFRDEYLRNSGAPPDHIVIFDEAQRAWGKEKTEKFMRQEKGLHQFSQSEPEYLLSVMARHD